jgi:DNA-binding transcriptional LysR family regulator
MMKTRYSAPFSRWSVRLTTKGNVFLGRCQRILAELEAAEQEISLMTKLPRGRLRVGLPYAAGLALPVIAGFMELFPEIELDLDFSDRVAEVIDEGLDVVIRGGEPKDSRLVSRRLGSFRVCLVAAPGYLKRRGIPSRPADLVNHDCLHYRYPSSGKLEPWPLKNSGSAAEGLILPLQEIKPGDTVWIPPGVKHWHGASATTAMSHLAVAETLDGKVVTWMEKVSDAQYGGRP